MYQLFNVLAWIWIVVWGLMLALSVFSFCRRLVKGWPVNFQLYLLSYGQLYGKVWIPPVVASILALTVKFDPTLQVWVVGISVAYLALRAVDVAILKGANLP